MSDDFNYLDKVPEAQESLIIMNLDVSSSNDVTKFHWGTNNNKPIKSHYLFMVYEKFNLLHKASVDTGCTKSIIK
jgi:hypothetical protein